MLTTLYGYIGVVRLTTVTSAGPTAPTSLNVDTRTAKAAQENQCPEYEDVHKPDSPLASAEMRRL